MFKTYNGGQPVKGGFYFNLEDWTMRVAPREGETLPGPEDARYMAFPTALLLVAAPVLSVAFVMFLPFIGIAMMVKVGVDKAALALEERRRRPAGEVRARVTK